MAPRKGFDYVTYNQRLSSIKIPNKIKCKVCKKIREQSAFSKRQLEELSKGMLKTGCNGISGQIYAGCMNCISGQVVELTCCVCDTTMALEFFSKNQRHDPDNARCKNCVQGHLEREPISEDLTETMEDEANLAASTTFGQSQRGDFTIPSFQGHSLAHNMYWKEGSVAEASNTNDIDSDEDNFSVPSGGVWLEQPRRCLLTETSHEGEGAKFTAFDPQGNPHIRTAEAPSVAPTMRSGWEGWGVTAQSRASSNTGPPRGKGSRGGFAKAPGMRFPKSEAPTMRRPQPTAATIESDDDDEDDDPQNYI
ncbi:hypothetical protein I7I50_06449 [Histoplasma capsulatum G186AR]|uniref:Stc1 domain-containing protein n=1 Tax=Ajellomyces capsulatus TaxID=5037 RepID=A0A8H7YZI0_AJECA|nr:hypothetical protein I7I52_10479 [Histoplasma capsulatum]QSS67390.1 hypothetical protein I7I50_06449 [Histoplasma capsulatum G186AR]